MFKTTTLWLPSLNVMQNLLEVSHLDKQVPVLQNVLCIVTIDK